MQVSDATSSSSRRVRYSRDQPAPPCRCRRETAPRTPEDEQAPEPGGRPDAEFGHRERTQVQEVMAALQRIATAGEPFEAPAAGDEDALPGQPLVVQPLRETPPAGVLVDLVGTPTGRWPAARAAGCAPGAWGAAARRFCSRRSGPGPFGARFRDFSALGCGSGFREVAESTRGAGVRRGRGRPRRNEPGSGPGARSQWPRPERRHPPESPPRPPRRPGSPRLGRAPAPSAFLGSTIGLAGASTEQEPRPLSRLRLPPPIHPMSNADRTLRPRRILVRLAFLLALVSSGRLSPAGSLPAGPAPPAEPSGSRLVAAARAGDVASILALLDAGVPPDAAQPDGAGPLHWAAHRDDLPVADLLLRAGADPNAVNDLGVAPLALACENASAAMVERLLANGADPDLALPTGVTPLMSCARTGSAAAVRSLLACGARVGDRETVRGQTALMWAISERHAPVAEALLRAGADVGARTRSGFTPLLFAAAAGGHRVGAAAARPRRRPRRG